MARRRQRDSTGPGWRPELSGLERPRQWLVAVMFGVILVLVALVIAFVAFG